jgi:hypothetical protein
MNALINHNQIEIFSTCEYLIEEALNYKFKLDRTGEPTKSPTDGKDHGITALEFIVVELPHNLQELRLSVYLPQGKEFVHDKHYYKVEKKKEYYDPFKKEDKNDRNNSSIVNRRVGNDHRHTVQHFAVSYSEAIESEHDDNFHDTGEYDRPLGAYIPGKR